MKKKEKGGTVKRKKVKMKSERGREAREGHDARAAMILGGVPTHPGAWTANLQLPCGSGLVQTVYFRRLLDDFFGDGAVLVSIFRKAAL